MRYATASIYIYLDIRSCISMYNRPNTDIINNYIYVNPVSFLIGTMRPSTRPG